MASWYTQPELHRACENDDLDRVRELVSVGVHIDVTDMFGRTPLHLACEFGHYDMMSELINMGANIESRDKSGLTPLLLASCHGHAGCTKELIRLRADVDTTTYEGWSCLHGTAYGPTVTGKGDFVLCAHYLLDAGIDTTLKDWLGRTAKMVAIEEKNFEIVAIIEGYENLDTIKEPDCS
jgi:ankyrin repeat protein